MIEALFLVLVGVVVTFVANLFRGKRRRNQDELPTEIVVSKAEPVDNPATEIRKEINDEHAKIDALSADDLDAELARLERRAKP